MKTNFCNLFATALALCALALASCDNNGNGGTGVEPVQTAENLSGSIYGTRTLDAAITYTITGPVIVEEGGDLVIPAGTTIKALKSFSSYILVLQGGKININGTADAPVTMTSAEANPASGDWGGLIINGRAPITGYNPDDAATFGRTEISNAYTYGGPDTAEARADSSGSITYLILSYTGSRTNADVEHNGLTLNGVGNGTKIENVFIPYGADDGIEFYGGSVNVRNLLVVNSDDDMFDFTQGYSGTLENAYGIWDRGYTSTEKDPRGIEADGNLDGLKPAGAPQSDFTVRNITIDLRLDYVQTGAADFATKAMQDVVKIRRGAKATITNMLVKGTGHVQDMVDFNDTVNSAPANGDAASSVSIINALVVPATGNNPDRMYNPAEYATVDITEGTTGGCDASIFAWTGYKF